MQSEDGGWAAFDVDNNWAVLNQVPFADHNAMLDPTCPDITGRVLECLCRRGMADHEAVRRGVAYLLQAQEKDGSWYGRWGVNYIYGSFLAMRGLAASGAPAAADALARAAKWLRAIQNADGGWGESCASYDAGSLRAGGQFGVADGVGAVRAAGGGRQRVGGIPGRRGIPSEAANGGGPMARRGDHRHGISERVLPDVRNVPGLLPFTGTVANLNAGVNIYDFPGAVVMDL